MEATQIAAQLYEFRKLGGKTIFERIFASTSPAHVQAEPDTDWVHNGGGDNVE